MLELKADLTLSLDVIYHLVEDSIYETYMKRLFSTSRKYVCIYAPDDENYNNTTVLAPHVHVRKFTEYISANINGWELVQIQKNKYPWDPEKPDDTSWSDFYIYLKSE